MSRYESVRGSESGESSGQSLVDRYSLTIKIAVFYLVAFGVGVLVRRLVDSPNAEVFLSIGIWFIVVFAVLSAVLGVVIKVVEVVHESNHSVR